MYSRIVCSSSPTVLTQYPMDQKCIPCTRFSPSCRWIRTALLPFKNPITNATLCLGGIDRHMCTWSGITCPSITSAPFCRHNSFRIGPTWFLSLPNNNFFRYFGTITTWYLHSHFTWDWLCHSCIWLSFQPQRAFRKESLFSRADVVHAGTAEPKSVHGQRPWFQPVMTNDRLAPLRHTAPYCHSEVLRGRSRPSREE